MGRRSQRYHRHTSLQIHLGPSLQKDETFPGCTPHGFVSLPRNETEAWSIHCRGRSRPPESMDRGALPCRVSVSRAAPARPECDQPKEQQDPPASAEGPSRRDARPSGTGASDWFPESTASPVLNG